MIPTADLLLSAARIADDLEDQILAYPEIGHAVRGAAQGIRIGVATARVIKQPLVQRRHLATSLEIAGNNLVGAIDRKPALVERATSLRDDGLGCLSLAMAAQES